MAKQSSAFTPPSPHRGPFVHAKPGPALAGGEPEPALATAFERLEEVHRRRAELFEEKRLLREREAELRRKLGSTWGIEAEQEKYRSALGRVELRDETAIVEQYVHLNRSVAPVDVTVQERFKVGDEYVRDPRLWSVVIAGERVLVRRFVRPQERFVRWILDPQARLVEAWPAYLTRLKRTRPGRAGVLRWLVLPFYVVFLILVKLQSLILTTLVRGQAKVAHTAVDLPIEVQLNVQTTREELSTETGRRRLRLAMFNARFLTPERRRVLVFLAATIMVVGYLLSEIVVSTSLPGLLEAKRQVDLLFFYSIGTRLFLPTPFEPLLLVAVPVIGFELALLATALGGVVGSWLLYLLGAQATEGLERLAKTRRWVRRSLDWAARLGPKHGYWILFVLMSIPFSVDSVAALASVFRLRVGRFLFIIFVSTLLRCALFLWLFS